MEAAWSPPWWRVAVYLVGASACAAVAAVEELAVRLLSLDAPGRLLVAVVAAGAFGLAGWDVLARPALRVGENGLDVIEGMRRRHLPWAAILRVNATSVTHRRRLVHLRVLEISTIDGPVLLGRRQLGADPDRVAAVVEERRLRHG
jgi:hypothetical protein